MKRYIFLSMFTILYLKASAQENKKIDIIYYLLDTLHTSVNDRMWEIDIEKGSIYKNYTILCPCLVNGGNPTFFYNIKSKNEGVYIKKKDLKVIKLVNLSYLILKSKRIEKNAYKRDYQIFLIEPNGNEYIMHEVDFTNTKRAIISPPDVTERKN